MSVSPYDFLEHREVAKAEVNEALFSHQRLKTPWAKNTALKRPEPAARPPGPLLAIPHFTLGGVRVKSCSRCGGVKPLTEYARNPKWSDGLDQTCKECKE